MLSYTLVTSDVNIENNAPTSWDCEKSKVRYEPYGHVITGDLNIVEGREVLKLFLDISFDEMDLNIALIQKLTGMIFAGSFTTLFLFKAEMV